MRRIDLIAGWIFMAIVLAACMVQTIAFFKMF